MISPSKLNEIIQGLNESIFFFFKINALFEKKNSTLFNKIIIFHFFSRKLTYKRLLFRI